MKYRKLTAEQKKLVLSLAELDKDVEEKVEGASNQTKSSKKIQFVLNR